MSRRDLYGQLPLAADPALRCASPVQRDGVRRRRVASGPAGENFVRQLADTLQVPVRAALSVQPMTSVFTLVGPTFNGIPGGVKLEAWGISRAEGVRAFTGPPPPQPQRGSQRPLQQSTR